MVEVSTNMKTRPGNDTAPPKGKLRQHRDRSKGRPARWARRGVSLILLCIFLCGGLAIGGFLRFVEEVSALETPERIAEAQAIVVLTGGAQRIDHAISLLNQGIGARLLISGVNPHTTGAQLKRLTSGSDALFECCVDIGHDAIDTIGNANETARWIAEHGFSKVLIVTNNYHIPRSMLELRRVDPVTEFIAYPVTLADLKTENWLTRPEVMRTMIGEYGKYAWAQLRTATATPTATGLRSDASRNDVVQVDTN